MVRCGDHLHLFQSVWVSLNQCVPKKGSMPVIENEKNELIPLIIITVWRICMDSRDFNKANHKDQLPLSSIDQMLHRLVENSYIIFFMVIRATIKLQ